MLCLGSAFTRHASLVRPLGGVFWGLVFFSLHGCGSSAPGTVPVSGTVKLDGEPLEGAEVFFLTDEEGWSAKTDKDGYFQFSSGTKPLKFRVSISKFEGKGVVLDPAAGMDEGQLMAMQMSDPSGKAVASVAKQLVPDKYSSRTATELTFMVPLGGTQNADFDLASK